MDWDTVYSQLRQNVKLKLQGLEKLQVRSASTGPSGGINHLLADSVCRTSFRIMLSKGSRSAACLTRLGSSWAIATLRWSIHYQGA